MFVCLGGTMRYRKKFMLRKFSKSSADAELQMSHPTVHLHEIIFKLLAREDVPLLGRRNALLVLVLSHHIATVACFSALRST